MKKKFLKVRLVMCGQKFVNGPDRLKFTTMDNRHPLTQPHNFMHGMG